MCSRRFGLTSWKRKADEVAERGNGRQACKASRCSPLAHKHAAGHLVKGSSLMDFKTIQRAAEGAYLSQKAQQEYDCEGERYRTLSASFHSGHMGDGQVIFSSDEPQETWEPVAPGTVGEGFWKIACGK